MSIINKKYLIILTSILLVITTILVFNNKDNDEVNNVKTITTSNSNRFAMYKETDNGYEEYNEKYFPDKYVLNLEKSKCLDNKGNEIENMLSYENNQVTVTSGKTSYCYLYFDKRLSTKIKDIAPHGLSTELKGDMYRFQGNQTDNIENYICFGTSDKQTCLKHQDQYMYRIIGIEESGRIKVIKKEALNQTYQWYTSYVEDIKLPDSVFFKAINGDDFLNNETYFPKEKWKEKISVNEWLYGDMLEDETGAVQDSTELYKMESSEIVTNWNLESSKEDGGLPYEITWTDNEVYPKGTILYYKPVTEKWNNTIKSKVSLLYLSDYSYSVGDKAKCNIYHESEEYDKCKLSWMHLSNNDKKMSSKNEWTMTRNGWAPWNGAYLGFFIASAGYINNAFFQHNWVVRPVFYINASQSLKDGTGKIDDPFIINE